MTGTPELFESFPTPHEENNLIGKTIRHYSRLTQRTPLPGSTPVGDSLAIKSSALSLSFHSSLIERYRQLR
jgi:hypothetical protein